jgi:hypothetical protein
MIDENENIPVLINVEKHCNNIILRLDEDVLTQSSEQNSIKIIELVECKDSNEKYDLLKNIIGERIDDHSKKNSEYCYGSFISMDSYQQIDIICGSITESTTNYEIDDLLFRSKILAKEYLHYKNHFLSESSDNENKNRRIITLISNEINRLSQKESFYKETNMEKYLITKSRLNAFEELLGLINETYVVK